MARDKTRDDVPMSELLATIKRIAEDRMMLSATLSSVLPAIENGAGLDPDQCVALARIIRQSLPKEG